MYQNTMIRTNEEELSAIKADVKGVENLIEKLLSQLLECTSITSERDFYACGI